MLTFNHNLLAYKYLLKYINQNRVNFIALLCDKNTRKYCLPHFLKLNSRLKNKTHIIEIKAGEKEKNIKTCENIWKHFIDNNFDRDALLINLGGGMVSDIGGFTASVYKRGIPYINVPTTLLAMVDAAIGGKTGIDFMNIKNVIGTITKPQMTIIDIAYLETLSKRELLNGFSEMLKYSLIEDNKLWAELKNFQINDINYKHIIKCVKIKNSIVNKDLNEKGIRKKLNFGHSIGHALESYFMETQKYISHGEAIAAGMIMESYISMKMKMLKKSNYADIINTFKMHYSFIEIPENAFLSIMKYLRNDKKNKSGLIYFVLLNKIGNAVIDIKVKEDLIQEAFTYYKDKFINT